MLDEMRVICVLHNDEADVVDDAVVEWREGTATALQPVQLNMSESFSSANSQTATATAATAVATTTTTATAIETVYDTSEIAAVAQLPFHRYND